MTSILETTRLHTVLGDLPIYTGIDRLALGSVFSLASDPVQECPSRRFTVDVLSEHLENGTIEATKLRIRRLAENFSSALQSDLQRR